MDKGETQRKAKVLLPLGLLVFILLTLIIGFYYGTHRYLFQKKTQELARYLSKKNTQSCIKQRDYFKEKCVYKNLKVLIENEFLTITGSIKTMEIKIPIYPNIGKKTLKLPLIKIRGAHLRCLIKKKPEISLIPSVKIKKFCVENSQIDIINQMNSIPIQYQLHSLNIPPAGLHLDLPGGKIHFSGTLKSGIKIFKLWGKGRQKIGEIKQAQAENINFHNFFPFKGVINKIKMCQVSLIHTIRNPQIQKIKPLEHEVRVKHFILKQAKIQIQINLTRDKTVRVSFENCLIHKKNLKSRMALLDWFKRLNLSTRLKINANENSMQIQCQPIKKNKTFSRWKLQCWNLKSLSVFSPFLKEQKKISGQIQFQAQLDRRKNKRVILCQLKIKGLEITPTENAGWITRIFIKLLNKQKKMEITKAFPYKDLNQAPAPTVFRKLFLETLDQLFSETFGYTWTIIKQLDQK